MANIKNEIAWLTERGITCTRLSDYHYRIVSMYDFWPSTGKWKAVHGTAAGRGKESLLAAIKKVYGKSPPRLEDEAPC
jgi:hypothetical protein